MGFPHLVLEGLKGQSYSMTWSRGGEGGGGAGAAWHCGVGIGREPAPRPHMDRSFFCNVV